MSVDKPAGGDGVPDRFSGREDRPFPGAPENREPAPELPKNTLSMEEVRAIHQKSSSNAEFEAAAKAHAEAQATDPDSPAQGSPAPGSAGQGPAEALGDGAAPEAHLGVHNADADGTAAPGTGVPGAWQPEGLAQPEGVTRPDLDLPPFPGAPDDQEAAPAAPGSTPSMEDIRAMHQRAASNTEFEAMAGEYAVTPGSGRGQVIDGPDGFFGRAGDLQDQEAVESGEPEGDERTGPGTRANTDTPQQTERGEETGGEKAVGEGQSEDNQEQKPKDLAPIEHPAPDAETDRPTEASAEAAPDQQPDDPRIAAMEARMGEFASMFESMQAKLEASEARNEELAAKNEQLEAKVRDLETGRQEDQAKLRDLEARVDGSDEVREQQVLEEDNEQAESLLNPDVIRSDEHQDDLSAAEQADAAELSDTAVGRAGREVNGEPAKAERAGFGEGTAQAGKDALGLAGSLGIVNPVVAMAASADSARRDFQKMEPADQLDVINLTDTATKAFGSMSPGTAVVAVTLATVGPLVEDKVRSTIHHFRRKD